MEKATAGQIQNQNQRQPQSNRQAVPATGNSQPDELKGYDDATTVAGLLARLDPNESLGIKTDLQRNQYHESGLIQPE
ncbi:hypothetical protein F2Q70_00003114 [Brassica cretica]|uniref:Uncharacterized protein n=1 Tax=Brassica cretica TaxID=69181 RepID=A0A8S9IWY3_BRACR|nr:hypothetical protein F2Q70_00003114 [Brassica cretica]